MNTRTNPGNPHDDANYRDIIYVHGPVARIILNRPRYRNAQTPRMVEEIDDAFARALSDDDVKVVVLSGAGDHFSAGHDIGTEERNADKAERGLTREFRSLYEGGRAYWFEASMRWRNLPIPTIAMVRGYCIYGGWIFASAMDLVFASTDALFLPSHTQYFTVPWDLGARKAKEILYEGRFITAAEASALGLVNQIYAPADLEAQTLAYAGRVAEGTRFRNRMVKFSVNHVQDSGGFTTAAEAAFHAHFINDRVHEADDPPEKRTERRLPGVGHATDLLARGFPARESSG